MQRKLPSKRWVRFAIIKTLSLFWRACVFPRIGKLQSWNGYSHPGVQFGSFFLNFKCTHPTIPLVGTDCSEKEKHLSSQRDTRSGTFRSSLFLHHKTPACCGLPTSAVEWDTAVPKQWGWSVGTDRGGKTGKRLREEKASYSCRMVQLCGRFCLTS